MATHDTPNTRQEIVRWIVLISYGILIFFFPSFVVAGVIRDDILRGRRVEHPKRRRERRSWNEWSLTFGN
jgi:hypothetical protein